MVKSIFILFDLKSKGLIYFYIVWFKGLKDLTWVPLSLFFCVDLQLNRDGLLIFVRKVYLAVDFIIYFTHVGNWYIISYSVNKNLIETFSLLYNTIKKERKFKPSYV